MYVLTVPPLACTSGQCQRTFLTLFCTIGMDNSTLYVFTCRYSDVIYCYLSMLPSFFLFFLLLPPFPTTTLLFVFNFFASFSFPYNYRHGDYRSSAVFYLVVCVCVWMHVCVLLFAFNDCIAFMRLHLIA